MSPPTSALCKSRFGAEPQPYELWWFACSSIYMLKNLRNYQYCNCLCIIPGCSSGYFVNGTTCSSCATLTSGGEEFMDNDINSCINMQQESRASLEYKLIVNENCLSANHLSLKIIASIETSCYYLELKFVTEKVYNSCGGKGFSFKGCQIKGSDVDGQNKICFLSCKCADSARNCEVQVFSSRVSPLEVQICEIQVGNSN